MGGCFAFMSNKFPPKMRTYNGNFLSEAKLNDRAIVDQYTILSVIKLTCLTLANSIGRPA